jgi:hypothetical protein
MNKKLISILTKCAEYHDFEASKVMSDLKSLSIAIKTSKDNNSFKKLYKSIGIKLRKEHTQYAEAIRSTLKETKP